jgi:hypothetical protein
MDLSTQYVTLLVVSVALTFLVGRLLVTAGEPFLQDVFQDKPVTRSVNLLLSVLFHLITLGVLAIISGIDLGPADPLQRFVTRLGVVLLILGVAYGISMLVLIRIRERRRSTMFTEQVQERIAERGAETRAHDVRPTHEVSNYPTQEGGGYPTHEGGGYPTTPEPYRPATPPSR